MNERMTNSKLKGNYKIQLLKDNEVVKEIKGSNFITKTALEVMRRWQATLVGGDISGIDSYRLHGYKKPNIFNNLILTDGVEPPNELEDMFLWGNIIGSANRTIPYSGSDIKLGTINTSESFVNEEKTLLVFDFPTHSANGNINSIGFAANNSTVSFYEFEMSTLPENLRYYVCGAREGDLVYMGIVGNSLAYKTYNLKTNKIETVNLGDLYCSLICGLRNDIYVLKSPHSTSDIYKLSADRRSVTDEKFILNKQIPSIRDIKEIDGMIYVCSYSDSIDPVSTFKYKESLYVFDLDGMFVKSVKTPNVMSSSVDRNNLCKLSEGVIALPTDIEGTIYNVHTGEFKSCQNTYNIFYDELTGKLNKFSNTTRYSFIPSSLATKFVLPETIVKTSAHTLKIEYEFSY